MSGEPCSPLQPPLWRCQVRREHEELRKTRLEEFMRGFNTISMRLKEMYQMITLGGDAELELVDSLDPFSEVLAPFSPFSPCFSFVGSQRGLHGGTYS